MKVLIFLIAVLSISCGKHEVSRPANNNDKPISGIEELSTVDAALMDIQSGNFNSFEKKILNNNLDINQILKNGHTFLIEAVIWQRVDIVDWLTKREEIDLEIKDKNGMIALDHAKIVANPQILKLIGNDSLTQEEINKNLITAIYAQDMDLIKEAIDEGAELNLYDEKGLTPLIIAIYLKDEQIVRYILQTRKADINMIDQRRKWTPLKWAKQQKLVRVEQMLVRLGASEL